MRRLVLVRHAKAEGAHPRGDHERGLLAEGVAAAVDLGRWLGEQGLAPDHVTVSTAARARATYAALQRGLADGVGSQADPATSSGPPHARSVWEDRRIYDGGVDGVLAVVAETPEEARVLWVVGHEPVMSTTAWELAQTAAIPADLHDELSRGFPTATAAVLQTQDRWSDLGFGGAMLVALRTGRAG